MIDIQSLRELLAELTQGVLVQIERKLHQALETIS